MSKKRKTSKPKIVPTQHQTSKWERQNRIRRIITYAAIVFLGGLIAMVSYGYYDQKIRPLREVVIVVNDSSFDLGYYIEMLEAYTTDVDPSQLQFMVDTVAGQIVQDEVLRQGADTLGIQVSTEEIDEAIEERDLPDGEAFRDIMGVTLLRDRIQEHFTSQLPDTMEQAHIQVLLVESRPVAYDVLAKLESGEEFATLVEEFSCNPQSEGDLGWLPRDLILNPLVGDALFDLEPGKASSIYDQNAAKSIGYWLIEVLERDETKGIKVRAIMLGSEQEAQEVKAKLSADNFAELADEYSQYGAAEEGGELGWLNEGDMNSEAFDEAAFNLDLNTVSDPVKDEMAYTTGGHWIVRVVDKGERELSQSVQDALATKAFNEWFAEYYDNSVVETFLDAAQQSLAIEEVSRGRAT